jgi:hypothetical protein
LLVNPRRVLLSLALRAVSFASKYIFGSRAVRVSAVIGAAHCYFFFSILPQTYFLGTNF